MQGWGNPQARKPGHGLTHILTLQTTLTVAFNMSTVGPGKRTLA